MKPRLQDKYRSTVAPQLIEEFSYSNSMMVPKLNKIVVNTCLSEAIQNVKILKTISNELSLITGQHAVITRARKSISNFRLREGMPLGAMVTLRRDKMWEFLDRFVNIALPRVRDFRGINPNGFDGRGNYSMGLTEQIIFPEVRYDDVKKINGMNITFVTSASTDQEGRALLKALGLPFRDS